MPKSSRPILPDFSNKTLPGCKSAWNSLPRKIWSKSASMRRSATAGLFASSSSDSLVPSKYCIARTRFVVRFQ